MWVTAYCDASFDRRRGGAWAAWLRCDVGRLTQHGRCPVYVKDSVSAELAAIYAAAYLAATTWTVRGILVCSDCRPALELAATVRPGRGASRRLQERLREVLDRKSIALETRWVAGHRPRAAGTSAFLNDWCDREAKRAEGHETQELTLITWRTARGCTPGPS
jgi:hypothetical protein